MIVFLNVNGTTARCANEHRKKICTLNRHPHVLAPDSSKGPVKAPEVYPARILMLPITSMLTRALIVLRAAQGTISPSHNGMRGQA
jgi:hypothetical protein